MGQKQARPMLDVHTVQQRLSRIELAYLRALFISLCQQASTSKGAPAAASSASGAGSAPPLQLSQQELFALRLPRVVLSRLLLAPAFPFLRPGQLDRMASLFAFQGHDGGSRFDWSEFLVCVWTLWYASGAGEEVQKLGFGLVDPAQSGRMGRKEYRRAAAPLWADHAAWVAAAAGSSSSSVAPSAVTLATAVTGADWLLAGAPAADRQPDSSSGIVRGLEREWLTSVFDVYFHLACYLFDRDHDAHLSPLEFSRFASEDLLFRAVLARGNQDARRAKQRLHELTGLTYAHIMGTGTHQVSSEAIAALSAQPLAAGASSNGAASARPASAATTPRRPSTSVPISAATSAAGMPVPGVFRTFLGDGEVEESSGQIWRRQRQLRAEQAKKANQRPAAAHAQPNSRAALPVR